MSSPDDKVVLLDPATDLPVGELEKLAAHEQGRYHAAISVLLLDGRRRHILQQRAASKYHAPGLWSNSCCSHPYPGESNNAAARRRLREELNVECKPLHFGTIRYRASVPAPASPAGWLIEHERVELYCASHTAPITPNPTEVSDIRCEATQDALAYGARLTPWFTLYLGEFGSSIELPSAQPIDFGYHDLVGCNARASLSRLLD